MKNSGLFFPVFANFSVQNLPLVRRCLLNNSVRKPDFRLFVLAGNVKNRYDCLPMRTVPKTGTKMNRTRVNRQIFIKVN